MGPNLAPRWRGIVVFGVMVLVLSSLAWLWNGSRLAPAYSIMAMGYPDYGGGSGRAGESGHGGDAHALGRSVTTFRGNTFGVADLVVTLTARKGRFVLADGVPAEGYTVNGTSPGPTIRATQGQLIEVRLVNESVPEGITLHWHGLDVPNAEDGVAGVTQDAVPIGHDFTYRFVARQVGTFWYHSHQLSHEQVVKGLLGALVITPVAGLGRGVLDAVALVHLYAGQRTINGSAGEVRLVAKPGDLARIRVVNTDSGPMSVWVSGAAYRLVAVDGTQVNGPTEVRDASVLLTAGGRADLEVRAPADGSVARVEMAGSGALLLGPTTTRGTAAAQPARALDLLNYGAPAPLRFDPAVATRHFEYAIGRRPGLLDGRPGMFWTINGHLFPDVPSFVVSEGDIVQMRISNDSGEVHPMHLHGHHVVVLARNGIRASGSPWVVDSLNVASGESYDVAFVADNPGIWMDHCHNLPHAAEGLVAHLMYEDVRSPFLVGGPAANQPE